MWLNPQENADRAHKLKKSLMVNFLSNVKTSVITGNVNFRLQNVLADYKEGIVITLIYRKVILKLKNLSKFPGKYAEGVWLNFRWFCEKLRSNKETVSDYNNFIESSRCQNFFFS